MIEAAKATGYSLFTARDMESLTIKLEHGQEVYKILKVVEFDSDRKMMTVVVRNTATGKTIAFCKGADISIL